jgi:NAD-dependent dihydropyrimidine dehydrogenase PreA subunit
MIRKIIRIDPEKCSGCGLCADACQEGAIGMVDGKAVLLHDDYCDGLGNCLPVCPEGAISFEEREAAEFDEAAASQPAPAETLACGCPGTQSRTLPHQNKQDELHMMPKSVKTELRQWPVQIKLVPVNAPYFENASLLVAADCTAYAYGNFHAEFMKNKVTLIGCPKLDMVDYTVKLEDIIRKNNIKSITVVRMEVPCCGGLEHAVKTALQNSGKMIPWRVVTLTTDGQILED